MSASRVCPHCGHAAGSHSNSREDDFGCMVEGCRCFKWLPSQRSVSDDDNVIVLRPEQDMQDDDRMLAMASEPEAVRRCRHWRRLYSLDREKHRAYCRDCGEEVPLFDVLEELCRSSERFVAQRKEAERRARVAEANLEDLLRQERNAKARVRTAVRRAPACNCRPQERARLSYFAGPWCPRCGGRRSTKESG